jgi:hypothetical protein
MARRLKYACAFSAATVAIILFGGFAHAFAGARTNRSSAAGGHAERRKGIEVVRMINSAELDFKLKEGRYGTWEEVYDSAYVKARQGQWMQENGFTLGAGPEIIPGWKLDFVVAGDRQGYQFMLRDENDKKCAFSFFSNQSGLIYQGKAIDCPVD